MIDVSQFEPLLFLQRNWLTIASECSTLPRNKIFPIPEYVNREDVAIALVKSGNPAWIKGWDGVDNWLNWGIAINYQFPLGDAGVPKTSALLRQVYGIKFANLSLFKGGVMLPLHTHPEMQREVLLTFHLGLDIPSECYLNVDGETVQEQNGRALVFDGSKPHYSFNASPNDRLILYCEFSPQKLSLAH